MHTQRALGTYLTPSPPRRNAPARTILGSLFIRMDFRTTSKVSPFRPTRRVEHLGGGGGGGGPALPGLELAHCRAHLVQLLRVARQRRRARTALASSLRLTECAARGTRGSGGRRRRETDRAKEQGVGRGRETGRGEDGHQCMGILKKKCKKGQSARQSETRGVGRLRFGNPKTNHYNIH